MALIYRVEKFNKNFNFPSSLTNVFSYQNLVYHLSQNNLYKEICLNYLYLNKCCAEKGFLGGKQAKWETCNKKD